MSDKMQRECLTLGMVQTNCYIVWNRDTKEAIVIDPADHPERIIDVLNSNQLTLKAILLTHAHFDHIGAVGGLKLQYDVPVYSHEAEEEMAKDPSLNLALHFGVGNLAVKVDQLVRDGEELEIAGFAIEAIHTPGHTSGGCCYYFAEEGVLFSGDTLFCGTVGRTDFPTGSYAELKNSVTNKLFTLPDETVVLPGHNEATTIAYEKANNMEV
ncbi:hydroxyacylglutathione hydrolase [Lachnospiraceae bacterium KM106-2]|nr:hydroxyacylglutathione hydrolase [Lachnospiraceae bacterium KM106-2]